MFLVTDHADVVSTLFHQGKHVELGGLLGRCNGNHPMNIVTMWELTILQRGLMGAFDTRPDRVAFSTSSVTNAASIGTDLQPGKSLFGKAPFGRVMFAREKVLAR
jgi:hypothetical protein